MRSEHPMFKLRNFGLVAWLWLVVALNASAQQTQQTLSWEQVRLRFEQNNPTLLADQMTVEESRAQEITAHLRPNPQLGLLSDQITPFNVGPDHGALAYLLPSATVSYLYERDHKRDLRLESAKKATGIAESSHADMERTMLFTLRGAFVSTLQAK